MSILTLLRGVNMLTLMKTTVRMDDHLYRRVKARAAEEGRTVAAVLEDAVRIGMDTTEPSNEEAERYFPTPLDIGSFRPGIDINSNSSILDALDEGLPPEKLR